MVDDEKVRGALASLQARFNGLRSPANMPTRRAREAAAVSPAYSERRAVAAASAVAKPTKGRAQMNFSVTASFRAELHAGAKARGLTAVQLVEAAVRAYLSAHPVGEVRS